MHVNISHYTVKSYVTCYLNVLCTVHLYELRDCTTKVCTGHRLYDST